MRAATLALLAMLCGCSLHGETRQTTQEDCYDKIKVGGLECTQVWVVLKLAPRGLDGRDGATVWRP